MIPLRDSHPAGRFPFWTLIIIAVNIYVFFQQLNPETAQSIVMQYALVPALVDFSNYLTLIPFITSQFLHGGFIHIISNMLFLWVFGDNVEARLGFLLFPIFYLLSGVAGAFLQYIFIPDSVIPMLGASGAIAGVLGAYMVCFPHHSVKTLIPVFGFFTVVNIPVIFMLGYWFVTQLFSGTASIALSAQNQSDVGGVAYFAHIGGFIFGWIVGQLYSRSELSRS